MDKRNWFKGIEHPWIGDPETGAAESYIPYLVIRPFNNAVVLSSWHSGYLDETEVFSSKEKIDSFIEALQQAREEVFD